MAQRSRLDARFRSGEFGIVIPGWAHIVEGFVGARSLSDGAGYGAYAYSRRRPLGSGMGRPAAAAVSSQS
jgi:hypothetical protein